MKKFTGPCRDCGRDEPIHKSGRCIDCHRNHKSSAVAARQNDKPAGVCLNCELPVCREERTPKALGCAL